MIVVALDGPPGDGSFVDSAVDAAAAVLQQRAASGVPPAMTTLVRPSADHIDPTWRAALAHGSALTEWALTAARAGLRVVLTDLPHEVEDVNGAGSLHFVDWAWDEGMAEVARRVVAEGGHVAALLTGPAFPPQQRIEKAVLESLEQAHVPTPQVLRASSFADLDEAPRLVAQLLEVSAPGQHVLTSAGPLGELVASQLRDEGRITHGITRRDTGHAMRVVSDVREAVERLLTSLVDDSALPEVTRCDFESGLLTIESKN